MRKRGEFIDIDQSNAVMREIRLREFKISDCDLPIPASQIVLSDQDWIFPGLNRQRPLFA